MSFIGTVGTVLLVFLAVAVIVAAGSWVLYKLAESFKH